MTQQSGASFVPSAAEMNPALSIPWAMHWPKRVFAAYSGSRCSGFVPPEASANRWTSSAVTVFSNSARSPTLTPSTASVIECSFYSSRGDHYRRIVRAREPPAHPPQNGYRTESVASKVGLPKCEGGDVTQAALGEYAAALRERSAAAAEKEKG